MCVFHPYSAQIQDFVHSGGRGGRGVDSDLQCFLPGKKKLSKKKRKFKKKEKINLRKRKRKGEERKGELGEGEGRGKGKERRGK